MKLACNLDQRGRQVRLVAGAIVDTCGMVLCVAGTFTGKTALLIGGIVAIVAGGFMIFEGAVGWCALRALGVKTKL